MKLSTVKCPGCGASLPVRAADATLACEYCGSVVVVTADEPARPTGRPSEAPAGPDVRCPECGRMNWPHFRFCLGCGGRL